MCPKLLDHSTDPYFDQELQQSQYRPDHRGGLVASMIEQGYALAFYSLRGYAPLRGCTAGTTFAERAADFVSHCVNSDIRAGADLTSTTLDTATVFDTLSTAPRTRDLPLIALAYSEGMHHVTALAGQRRIAPVGIVGVGGPHIALADTWAYQMKRDYLFQLAQDAFDRCPALELSIDQIFDCAQVPIRPELRSGMLEFLGADRASRISLAARRQVVLMEFQNVLTHYAGDMGLETMDGGFGGVRIRSVWSARYYSQVFQARASSVRQLFGYRGRIIYLFGTLDHLVPTPLLANCAEVGDCQFRMVNGVGHGLEDLSGLPPPHALSAIVDAVNAISASQVN